MRRNFTYCGSEPEPAAGAPTCVAGLLRFSDGGSNGLGVSPGGRDHQPTGQARESAARPAACVTAVRTRGTRSLSATSRACQADEAQMDGRQATEETYAVRGLFASSQSRRAVPRQTHSCRRIEPAVQICATETCQTPHGCVAPRLLVRVFAGSVWLPPQAREWTTGSSALSCAVRRTALRPRGE